jgi:hypothetical protein
MRDLAILFVHFLATIAKLMRPGGGCAVVAESVLLKHQLMVLNRGRDRAPNLRPIDRILAGLCALFIRPHRLLRVAVVLRPSTLLAFHAALVRRKYRQLFTPKRRCKSGPKGPSPELIGFGIHAGAVDGPSLCRMFNRAIRGAGLPKYLSSDNDPLFRFHQWKANLRILDVTEVKTVPYLPISHPFVERLIGTIRRVYLDLVPFWTARDLENKLLSFKEFYNDQRCHLAFDGDTPRQRAETLRPKLADLDSYRWHGHCRGVYNFLSRLSTNSPQTGTNS